MPLKEKNIPTVVDYCKYEGEVYLNLFPNLALAVFSQAISRHKVAINQTKMQKINGHIKLNQMTNFVQCLTNNANVLRPVIFVCLQVNCKERF